MISEHITRELSRCNGMYSQIKGGRIAMKGYRTMKNQKIKAVIKPQPNLDKSSSQDAPSALKILEELFDLLEDYSPTWYTETHHRRAVAVLRTRQSAA